MSQTLGSASLFRAVLDRLRGAVPQIGFVAAVLLEPAQQQLASPGEAADLNAEMQLW